LVLGLITDLCALMYSWLLVPSMSGISFRPMLARASKMSMAEISS